MYKYRQQWLLLQVSKLENKGLSEIAVKHRLVVCKKNYWICTVFTARITQTLLTECLQRQTMFVSLDRCRLPYNQMQSS